MRSLRRLVGRREAKNYNTSAWDGNGRDYGTGTWSTNSTPEKEEGPNSWGTLREINYLEYLAVGLVLLHLGCLLNSVQCSGSEDERRGCLED